MNESVWLDEFEKEFGKEPDDDEDVIGNEQWHAMRDAYIAACCKHAQDAERWRQVAKCDDIWFSRVTDRNDDNYGQIGVRKYGDETIYADTHAAAIDAAQRGKE